MRLVMENLSKKELNGQNPVVALPTKQALNQFESQQKTRPTPPVPPNQKTGPGMGGMGGGIGPPNHGPQRMMNPNPMMRGPNPMMNHGGPPGGPMRGPGPMNHQMPQRFQGNNWNNGPPRPNGMPPNGRPMNPMNMNQRPMGMPIPRPRPDWNNGRPPMHHQGNFGQQGGMPPRGPPGMPNQPAPHVNPAFFPQNPGPMQGMPPNFNQGGPPRNWPGNPNIPPAAQQPPISEAEFEEIMGRNRTVSSSAIARAVSDAAAGEYASAIETLATAISLIKQSKVANDERCKILITSLQDTLQGIEAKSYNRRERSDRSRSRERRSRRRERSSSRGYSRRSRSREHRDHRDRNRDE
jgi:cleavage and polyadenylation specificity factor subunit 6/7